ncbi:unnamed protein product, partial [Larinioides sclopetarius]
MTLLTGQSHRWKVAKRFQYILLMGGRSLRVNRNGEGLSP